ncbi:hypothetical protein [Thauera sp.]|uniref:hypothetical protein n=1 Tax=Thauera sp. TaxID=1905334 RepID=UPI002B54C88B|nr:hypothetical protein [Thauera sp.]HRP26024.1 hypothetical protein [Thauera sp.]
MANLTITAANVIAGAGSVQDQGLAGTTITAGEVIYQAATKKALLADADEDTALERAPKGIALNGASDGQPLRWLKAGPITIGATLTPGTFYYLSDDPGKICPLADVTGGDYIVQIGYAKDAAVLMVDFQITNVATAP